MIHLAVFNKLIYSVKISMIYNIYYLEQLKEEEDLTYFYMNYDELDNNNFLN